MYEIILFTIFKSIQFLIVIPFTYQKWAKCCNYVQRLKFIMRKLIFLHP